MKRRIWPSAILKSRRNPDQYGLSFVRQQNAWTAFAVQAFFDIYIFHKTKLKTKNSYNFMVDICQYFDII